MAWGESRCFWCHRSSGNMLELRLLEPKTWGQGCRGCRVVTVFVHAEHERETRCYYGKVRRYARDFLVSILFGCAAPFVFLAFRWLPGNGASLIYLGIILWLFPFATSTAIDVLGIQNSVRLARTFAVLISLGGMTLLAQP